MSSPSPQPQPLRHPPPAPMSDANNPFLRRVPRDEEGKFHVPLMDDPDKPNYAQYQHDVPHLSHTPQQPHQHHIHRIPVPHDGPDPQAPPHHRHRRGRHRPLMDDGGVPDEVLDNYDSYSIVSKSDAGFDDNGGGGGGGGGGGVSDAVFGTVEAGKGPNYRNVGWIGSTVLMTKGSVGIGVLSLPLVLHTLGFIPGIIIIVFVMILCTWCAWVLGQFKLLHPEVYAVPDVGTVMWGPIGRECLAICFFLFMIMTAAGGIVSLSVSLNAVSLHATCTAVFVAVAAVCGFLTGSIRTLGEISWLGWIGCISIVASILTLTVAVGIEDRPADAPNEGPWDRNIKLINNPSFSDAMNAVSSVVFACGALPAYFGIISEMREPRQFTRSLLVSQIFVTLLYTSIAAAVYAMVGQYVSNPALGTAGRVMKRVCYGIAIPGLLVTLCMYTHLPAKYVFVRLLRGTKHLTSNSFTHWFTWLACTLTCTIIAYVVASAIPDFGALVQFVGALFSPIMTFIPFACMWWYDCWRGKDPATRSLWTKLHGSWALFVFVIAIYCTVAGTYAAVIDLINADEHSSPWSCADNSRTRMPNGTLY